MSEYWQPLALSKRQNTSNPVGSHWTSSKAIVFSDDVVFNAKVLNGDDGLKYRSALGSVASKIHFIGIQLFRGVSATKA